MEMAMNMGASEELDNRQMMEVDGGSGVWDYVVGYLLGKVIDWFIDNRHEIWQDFCDGPSKNDPMFSTPYVQFFSR